MESKKLEIELEIFWGDVLSEHVTVPECDDENRMLSFFSQNKILDLSDSMCSKHILMIGGIGSGKTNTFYQIIDNLDTHISSDDIMLIFDTKGDFYSLFYEKGYDYVIGNSSMFSGETSYWNIFREIEYGGVLRDEKELIAKEIAKSLFQNRKNSSQPFFSSAAMDLFAKVLIGTMRSELWDAPEYRILEKRLEVDRNNTEARERQILLFEEHVNRLNNSVLVNDIFHKWQTKDFLKLLNDHDDFKSSITYIGDGTSNQALGVFGELNSMINDYFVGIFGNYKQGKDVSFREMIHNKGGKKIFIEYDLSIGQVLTPIYTLMIDLGLKEALGRTRSEGNTFLVIDEFKLLPKLSHIDDALNFGRSLGIKVFAGIQNIKQLEDVYGETRGQVIASGFSNIFAFRMTDEASRKYVCDLFGKNFLSITYWNKAGEEKQTEREGYTVEEWNLMNLKTGEAVIGASGCVPFKFQFEEFTED